MSAKNSTTVTAETVVNDAVKEKLVTPTVPAQAEPETVTEGEKSNPAEEQNSGPELSVVEGGKKSAKEKLTAVFAKAKEKKNALILLGVVTGAVAVAIAKAAKKQAVAALENLDEETTDNNSDETPALEENPDDSSS
jgi:hypothetical protein